MKCYCFIPDDVDDDKKVELDVADDGGGGGKRELDDDGRTGEVRAATVAKLTSNVLIVHLCSHHSLFSRFFLDFPLIPLIL